MRTESVKPTRTSMGSRTRRSTIWIGLKANMRITSLLSRKFLEILNRSGQLYIRDQRREFMVRRQRWEYSTSRRRRAFLISHRRRAFPISRRRREILTDCRRKESLVSLRRRDFPVSNRRRAFVVRSLSTLLVKSRTMRTSSCKRRRMFRAGFELDVGFRKILIID